MNENQKPMEENSTGGGAKKFFRSKLFMVLLILVLEFVFALVSAQVFSHLRPTNGELNFSAVPVPLIIFWVVCAVIAVPAAFRVIRGFMIWLAAPGPLKKQGVIRIITEEQYQREQFDMTKDKIFAFVTAFIFTCLLAPFIAPIGIGITVHKLLNKHLK